MPNEIDLGALETLSLGYDSFCFAEDIVTSVFFQSTNANQESSLDLPRLATVNTGNRGSWTFRYPRNVDVNSTAW